MKTTDLIFENQKVLNAMQNLVLQSKKHIEFLAVNAPEIRTNLESVAESMQTLADMLENQIVLTVIHATSLQKKSPAKIKHTTL